MAERSANNKWGANYFMSAETKPRKLDKNKIGNPFKNETHVREFVEMASMRRIATTNENSEYPKTFRLYIHGVPVCVEADKDKINSLLTFAQSVGIKKSLLMDHLVASFSEIRDPHNNVPISFNRHRLDFRFQENPIDPKYRKNSLTLREALKNMDRII